MTIIHNQNCDHLHDQAAEKITDDLTYSSYTTQRALRPDIPYEQWGKIYGPLIVEAMEERYQDKFGSCKMCGEPHDLADLSNRVCCECREDDLADYRYEQKVDKELLK